MIKELLLLNAMCLCPTPKRAQVIQHTQQMNLQLENNGNTQVANLFFVRTQNGADTIELIENGTDSEEIYIGDYSAVNVQIFTRTRDNENNHGWSVGVCLLDSSLNTIRYNLIENVYETETLSYNFEINPNNNAYYYGGVENMEQSYYSDSIYQELFNTSFNINTFKFSADYNTLQSAYNSLNTQYEHALSDINYYQGLIDPLREEISTLTHEKEELQNEYDTLNQNYQTLQNEYDTLNQYYQTLQSVHNQTLRDFDDLRNRYAQLVLDNVDLQSRYDHLTHDYEELLSNYQTLEDKLANAQTVETFTDFLKMIAGSFERLIEMEILPHIKVKYIIAMPLLFFVISLALKLIRGA